MTTKFFRNDTFVVTNDHDTNMVTITLQHPSKNDYDVVTNDYNVFGYDNDILGTPTILLERIKTRLGTTQTFTKTTTRPLKTVTTS